MPRRPRFDVSQLNAFVGISLSDLRVALRMFFGKVGMKPIVMRLSPPHLAAFELHIEALGGPDMLETMELAEVLKCLPDISISALLQVLSVEASRSYLSCEDML